jgi:hypothetical protein
LAKEGIMNWRQKMMNLIQSDIKAAARGEISLKAAESRLRGEYGGGGPDSVYQRIYDYLDVFAGQVDGGREVPEDRENFVKFLNEMGFFEMTLGEDKGEG